MKCSIVCLLLAALSLIAVPVVASAPPGGTGWLTVNCNVDGASVYLDGTYKGTTTGGSLDIENGAYAGSYTVSKTGYYDASGNINYVPGGDPNLEITVTLEPKPTGSGKGWFTVYCNVDGATVAFNGVTKGTISGGSFTQEVSTTGTPYTSYSVSRSGYLTYSGSIAEMPADGQTVSLYATLNPVPTTSPTTIMTPVGGDQGWYQVSCNVNGAFVYFDSDYKGEISGGSLTVPVYSTGTPYKTWRVEKGGYVTATGSLPAAPAKGQTVNVYVTLNPVSTPTPYPTATEAPLGSEHGWIAVHTNVDGATVTLGGYDMGITRNGVLKIQVSTTGTPYSTFTVSKAGYATVTGTIPRNPTAGETVDVYATLTEEPVPVPTTQSPLPLSVIAAGLIGAIALMRIRE
jgi:hypothetical protein